MGRGGSPGVPVGLSRPVPSPPQVEAARKAVRAAQVERYVPEHERRCWCLCCGCEVRKHLSHGNLTVLHGGLLEHLASPEHKKATNRFWWENKAEFQMKEKFLISPQDYARKCVHGREVEPVWQNVNSESG